MTIAGTAKTDDYGNVHFAFDDGTFATVYWIPTGELDDGQGGGFEEDEIETDSTILPSELVRLAYLNDGAPGPINI